MNTKIHTLNSRSRAAEKTTVDFRSPNYDCREQAEAVKLVVYVPGVDFSGVEIMAHGPDLVVTARKKHFVRVNFNAARLEDASKDYRLTLRLGHGLDYANLNAEMEDGILTITVPKRTVTFDFGHFRRVA